MPGYNLRDVFHSDYPRLKCIGDCLPMSADLPSQSTLDREGGHNKD